MDGWIQSWQEFKMAAIIELSQIELSDVLMSKIAEIQDDRIQDGWQPSFWLWMNEFESEWISLCQNQSGGTKYWHVWVNLREENKVS